MDRFKPFSGVYAHDQLNHKLNPDEFGIINLDVSTGPGTHWVAFFNGSNHKDAYYFDPFGLPPDDRTIKFLKTSGKPVAYNTSQLQDLSSQKCGWFCKKWLTDMASGKSMYDALYQQFTQKPSEENEELVKK